MQRVAANSSSGIFRYRGLKMVGVLNRPASHKGRRFPAVLFLHGLPGAEKSVDIQRGLLKRGVGSFALHFCGAWGSEGTYSFSGLVDQARAGLRFLRRQDFVDPRRVAIFGFSMGGWTAIHVGARESGLQGVVAVAPVGGPDMITSRTRRLIRDLCRPLRVRSAEALYRDFIRTAYAQDPAQSAAHLRCPLLLVHGDRDELVPLRISRRILDVARVAHQPARTAEGSKTLVISRGARHDFLDRREWLTRVVCSWLAKRLRNRTPHPDRS